MKHIENTNIYKAEKGKLIVRKLDDFIMGDAIDLGSADSIENYKDEPYTDKSYKKFCKSVEIGYKVRKESER